MYGQTHYFSEKYKVRFMFHVLGFQSLVETLSYLKEKIKHIHFVIIDKKKCKYVAQIHKWDHKFHAMLAFKYIYQSIMKCKIGKSMALCVGVSKHLVTLWTHSLCTHMMPCLHLIKIFLTTI